VVQTVDFSVRRDSQIAVASTKKKREHRMDRNDVLIAWKRILTGHKPVMSIEITRECPLRCPGCYAYDDQHLGGGAVLRDLIDLKGDQLVRGVISLVEQHRPLHLSIVGGDPLVRYRELQVLVPELIRRGIYVQVVTSAFREIPRDWANMARLKVVVSIDGLQPEHDQRRKPATYDRILKNVAGNRITVHCTVTSAMLKRPTYVQEFLDFWSRREEVQQIWISIFTPQLGSDLPETPTPDERDFLVRELLRLQPLYPKLDMKEDMIRQFASPPHSPSACVFAQVTETISADLKTRITPCQFGGNPDCSRCGCVASMALNAVAENRIAGIPVRALFTLSTAIGNCVRQMRPSAAPTPEEAPAAEDNPAVTEAA
jgi:MoaA/NifB/PqqE/SkfB family radical SAM enzyme